MNKIYTTSSFLAALFLSTLILFACQKKEGEIQTQPPPREEKKDIIKPTVEEPFLNEMVKTAYEKHKKEKVCGESPQAESGMYNQAYETMEWISSKRGLEFDYNNFVPICVVDENKYIEENLSGMNKNLPSYQIFGEKLKGIGFLKADYDYISSITEDQKNFIASFDPDSYRILTKKEGIEASTLAHELTHVLQFTHYPDASLTNSKQDISSLSWDEIQSRIILREGEAELTEAYYKGKFTVTHPELDEADIPFFKIPHILKYKISVPFIWTATDTESQYSKDALESLWRSYPKTSEQILFPEKYISGEKGFTSDKFKTENLNVLFSKDHGYSKIIDFGSRGVLGLSIIAKTYLPHLRLFDDNGSWNTAKGWDGDAILLGTKSDDKGNFEWQDSVSVIFGKWDTPEFAEDYAKLLMDLLEQKYKENPSIVSSSEDYFEMQYTLNGATKNSVVMIKNDRTIFIDRITEDLIDTFYELAKDDKIFNFLSTK